jgi:hypothetical protein
MFFMPSSDAGKKGVSKKPASRVPPYVEIGKRFVEARHGRKVTEIKKKSGVANSIIDRCEKGEQAPNLELLAFYSQVEGVPADLILFGNNDTQDSFAALRLRALGLTADQKLALAAELINSEAPVHEPKAAV